MTTRALAMKLRRLENLAKMRPGWHDAEADSSQVVLPPLEEFRALPLEEQKRLLSAWRPSPCDLDLLPLEEFEKLPVQERIRLMEEAMGPPDSHLDTCFDCLPLSEQVNMCRGEMHMAWGRRGGDTTRKREGLDTTLTLQSLSCFASCA